MMTWNRRAWHHTSNGGNPWKVLQGSWLQYDMWQNMCDATQGNRRELCHGTAEALKVTMPKLLVSVCGIPPDEASSCCFRRQVKVKAIDSVKSIHVLGDLDDDLRTGLAFAQDWFNVSEHSDQILRHPHGHRFPLDSRPLAEAMRKAIPEDLARASLGGC